MDIRGRQVINFKIQERYLKDPLPIRLGGLAADLSRIASFLDDPGSAPAVSGLIQESRWFVEWSAPELLPDRVEDAIALVDIQRSLTHWHWIWNDAQNDPTQRAKLAEQAQAWSDQVLEMSGLLNEQ